MFVMYLCMCVKFCQGMCSQSSSLCKLVVQRLGMYVLICSSYTRTDCMQWHIQDFADGGAKASRRYRSLRYFHGCKISCFVDNWLFPKLIQWQLFMTKMALAGFLPLFLVGNSSF